MPFSSTSSSISTTSPGETISRNKNNNNTQHKSKLLVAWMVSNCDTRSQREYYVLELQRHIPVDVYSSCGNVVTDADKRFSCPKSMHSHCWKMIDQRYKVCDIAPIYNDYFPTSKKFIQQPIYPKIIILNEQPPPIQAHQIIPT